MAVEKKIEDITKLEELPLVDLAKIFLTKVVDLENNKVRTDASLSVGDIQIGAVELKDEAADIRANIEQIGTGALTSTLKALIGKVKAFISDASGTMINPAKEDGNLAALKASAENLDVALSTVATESSLASVDGKTPALGQALKAASSPIAIASDQDALPIKHQDSAGNGITSKDEGAGIRSVDVNIRSGGAGFEIVGVKDTGDTRINPAKEDGNIALIKAKTDNLDVALSTVATDATASSIDGKTPALGQAVKTASSPVVIASDQDSLPIKAQDGSGNNLTSKDEGGAIRSLDVNTRSEKKNVSVFSSNDNSLVAAAQTITTAISANKQINLINVQFITLTTKTVRVGFWDGSKFWLIKEDLAFKVKDIVITDIIRTNMEVRVFASQTAGDSLSVKVEYEL